MADNPKTTPVPVTSYPTALSVAQVGQVRLLTNTLAQQALNSALAGVDKDAKAVIVDLQGDDGHVAALIAGQLGHGWSLAFAADKALGAGASAGFKGVKWEAIARKVW